MNPSQVNLTSLKTIKSLLETYGARPKKRLGQNFLIDTRALDKILGAADLSPQDTVVEIGPGIGTLTRELAQKAKTVIAIEKDEKMVEVLKETLKGYRNVELLRGDIFKTNFQFLISNFQSNPNVQLSKQYKVVANLPYYITSPVIRKFLEAEHKPKLMVLMVQKEVAQRICSKPPNMNLLAVSVQFYGVPKIVSYVKRTSFWPQPDVDSAILKITLKHAEPDAEPRRFFTLVRAGFKHPRKQLVNNLFQGIKLSKPKVETWLSKAGIHPTQRAQTLALADWIKLASSLQ